jgi:chromodomain-helicase-DNA-binding protein 7
MIGLYEENMKNEPGAPQNNGKGDTFHEVNVEDIL